MHSLGDVGRGPLGGHYLDFHTGYVTDSFIECSLSMDCSRRGMWGAWDGVQDMAPGRHIQVQRAFNEVLTNAPGLAGEIPEVAHRGFVLEAFLEGLS